MTNPTPRAPWFCGVCLAGLLLAMAAPQPIAAAAPTSEDLTTWSPAPSPGRPISLEEAVAIAVAYAGDVELSRERARGDGGRLRESSGLFDTSFQASSSIGYEVVNLTQAEIDFERNKRLILREVERATQAIADSLRDQLANDDGLIFYDCPTLGLDLDGDGVDDVDFDLEITDLLVCYSPSDRAWRELTYNLAGNINQDELQEDLEEANRRIIEESLAIFDTVAARARDALRRFGAVPTQSETTTLSLDLSFFKTFRNGMVFQPGLNLETTRSTYVGKPTSVSFGGKGTPDTTKTNFSLNLDVPLGKGRGRASAAAPEAAARETWSASLNTAGHTAALAAVRTTLAYWNLVGAQQSLELLEASLATTGRLLEIGEALVEIDEIAAVDVVQLRARHTETSAQVIEGRRTVFEARLALADAMGVLVLSPDQAPVAAETFPEMPDEATLDGLAGVDLTGRAMARRGDLKASYDRLDSARILAEKSRVDLRRKVDLGFNLSYRGLAEGDAMLHFDSLMGHYGEALFFDIPGPSAAITLKFELPIQNNVAEGQLEQSRALEYQAQINATELERVIRLTLEGLRRSLVRTAREVAARATSAEEYRELLESQLERFRLGESRVVETILTEQSLISQELALVSAQQQFFTLLSRLRFESGSIVDYRVEDGRVFVRDLQPFGYLF